MHRKNAIIFLIIGLLITTIIYYILPERDKTTLNLISLTCNILALYGLILAYLQIMSIKEVSKETKAAVMGATRQFEKVLSISELSKSKKLVDEIQQYLHNDNLYGALIRMKDLKETLIQVKYSKDLEPFTQSKTYRTIISDTGVDINSINDYLLKHIITVDKSLISRHLEQTKSHFIEFENQLKFHKNG